MKAYELKQLKYEKHRVLVTRNGKGPGKVTYNGHFAGTIKVGKGNNLEYWPTRWASRWEEFRFLRDRAKHLYRLLMQQFKTTTRKVNWRRKRNRSHRTPAMA